MTYGEVMSRRRRSAAGQLFLPLVVVCMWLALLAADHGNGSREAPELLGLIEGLSIVVVGLGMARVQKTAIPVGAALRGPSNADLLARLQVSQRAANIAFWECDLATGEVFVSAEWKAQLGYQDEEIPDRMTNWESWLHPGDLEPMRAFREALASTSPEGNLECRLRHRDGAYRWMQVRADRLGEPGDRRGRALGCNVDITERRMLEEQSRQLREHVERGEQMSEMGALVAGVAHELRDRMVAVPATLYPMRARG